jgi:hypothetical protein
MEVDALFADAAWNGAELVVVSDPPPVAIGVVAEFPRTLSGWFFDGFSSSVEH